MGTRHRREDILDGAMEVAASAGLSQVTFGRVAAHLGMNDRTVVYYFPRKDDLIEAVLTALGGQLQEVLAPAFATPKADHAEVVATAWPLLSTPAAAPTFALYFEALGLAAAGRDPYRRIVPMLLDGWIDWTASLIAGPPARRRAEAVAAVAILDGLLLLRQLTDEGAVVDRAARRLSGRPQAG